MAFFVPFLGKTGKITCVCKFQGEGGQMPRLPPCYTSTDYGYLFWHIYSVSCQTFPLFSCQFWALKWLKFQNQPDFWKIPNLNFLVVLEFFKTIEKWKIFINGWKKQCHFFGFLNISSVSILRNPQKWHCFFQPLIKNFFWKFQNH